MSACVVCNKFRYNCSQVLAERQPVCPLSRFESGSTSGFAPRFSGTVPTGAAVAFPTKPTGLGLSADRSKLHKIAHRSHSLGLA